MKVKDFFKLALKLIAIFYAVNAIYSIIGNLQYFIYANNFINITTLWIVISILVPVIIYYLIFVKSDKLIKVLKIDQGFENQEINFGNLTQNEVLKIAFIIFGLIMIVWGLPSFLTNCFYAFKYSVEPQFLNNSDGIKHDHIEIIQSAIYILLGYLMISNYKRITNWFD